MAKEEMLEFEGVVVEVLPDGRMRVQMDNGHATVAYTAGRVKKNRIRMIAGDRVTVEMTPYDLITVGSSFATRPGQPSALVSLAVIINVVASPSLQLKKLPNVGCSRLEPLLA
jgi:translation initiation factor IF-1